MSELMSYLERYLNPLVAAIVAAVGAVIGSIVYVSFSGLVAGAILSLGLACAVVSLLSVVGMLSGAQARPAYAAAGMTPAALDGPFVTAMASTGTPPSNTPKATASGGGAPTETPAGSDATESEAALLSSGRFAEYHLAKAIRLYNARNYKEAAYQCGASLSHDDIPEAKELLAKARAAK